MGPHPETFMMSVIDKHLQVTRQLALCGLVAASLLSALGTTALAQQTPGAPGSPGATTTIDGKQLPPPDPTFGGVIKDDALQSKPWWPPRVVPPKSAPNVLLIITDDAGFGVPSTFGGVIPTPTMDRIANDGLRYTNFHSTALCSPTRAALITGRNHHSVGYGVVTEQSTGFPGYNSIIGKDNATIGRILLENGYRTSWFGKDHNTPDFTASQAVRPVADGHGLRVLLRVRRRRNRSQPGVKLFRKYPGHFEGFSQIVGHAAGDQRSPDCPTAF